jgi:hypothetical protein
MKGRHSRQLDTVIGQLFDEFIKADKVRNDPDYLNLIIKTLKHFSEIQDFKGMYKKYFIPKVNEYLVDLRKVIQGSKFKKLITNEFVDLEENKNETIRLAVVGLFHKYESFRKDLVRNFNEFFTKKGIQIEIQEYIEQNFDFKLRDNWKNQTLFEVNWICNRIKHDSSLPISFENPNNPIPGKFQNMDSESKIIITTKDLYNYYDLIYQYCHDLFQLFNQVNLKIQLSETGIDKPTETFIDKEIEKRISLLNNRDTDANKRQDEYVS